MPLKLCLQMSGLRCQQVPLTHSELLRWLLWSAVYKGCCVGPGAAGMCWDNLIPPEGNPAGLAENAVLILLCNSARIVKQPLQGINCGGHCIRINYDIPPVVFRRKELIESCPCIQKHPQGRWSSACHANKVVYILIHIKGISLNISGKHTHCRLKYPLGKVIQRQRELY